MHQPAQRSPITPGPAAVRLQKFLDRYGISIRAASDALSVTHPTFIAWLRGSAKPDAARRKLIAIWTDGDIPDDLWLTDAERRALRRIAPFRPESSV